MTGGGPLGRSSVSFAETMKRLHGEIERLVYAAEINCPITDRRNVGTPTLPENVETCRACSFREMIYRDEDGELFECRLGMIRDWCGDHIQQHDAMPAVQPCQCAGRCNK